MIAKTVTPPQRSFILFLSFRFFILKPLGVLGRDHGRAGLFSREQPVVSSRQLGEIFVFEKSVAYAFTKSAKMTFTKLATEFSASPPSKRGSSSWNSGPRLTFSARRAKRRAREWGPIANAAAQTDPGGRTRGSPIASSIGGWIAADRRRHDALVAEVEALRRRGEELERQSLRQLARVGGE
jgi:hypothetical protein